MSAAYLCQGISVPHNDLLTAGVSGCGQYDEKNEDGSENNHLETFALVRFHVSLPFRMQACDVMKCGSCLFPLGIPFYRYLNGRKIFECAFDFAIQLNEMIEKKSGHGGQHQPAVFSSGHASEHVSVDADGQPIVHNGEDNTADPYP